MRIDNDGEGGIIALLALLGVKKQHRPAIVAAGLFGAALIYGDGTITPAISVLSALEGMEQIAPSLQTYVLPASVVIFYHLCPSVLLTPLVVLATIATIASQSIITGAFSMTRQAIALGWMPRLRIIQTSEEGYGQIYVGAVNWLLMIATL